VPGAGARLSTASTIGGAIMIIPGPPPNGASSTVRWKSLVNSLGLTVRNSTSPFFTATASIPVEAIACISSGKIETTLTRIDYPSIRPGMGRIVISPRSSSRPTTNAGTAGISTIPFSPVTS